MNGFTDWLTVVLCVSGAVFFTGGTLGLLRFPDLLSRLHALTKADNLGLGLVVAGLCLQAGGLAGVVKLILIWALALVAGSSMCFLLGRHELERRSGRSRNQGEENKQPREENET